LGKERGEGGKKKRRRVRSESLPPGEKGEGKVFEQTEMYFLAHDPHISAEKRKEKREGQFAVILLRKKDSGGSLPHLFELLLREGGGKGGKKKGGKERVSASLCGVVEKRERRKTRRKVRNRSL